MWICSFAPDVACKTQLVYKGADSTCALGHPFTLTLPAAASSAALGSCSSAPGLKRYKNNVHFASNVAQTVTAACSLQSGLVVCHVATPFSASRALYAVTCGTRRVPFVISFVDPSSYVWDSTPPACS